MPATKDGRCWSCVQRRRWYDVELTWTTGDVRHLIHGDRPLCELPRRGRSRDPEAVREYGRRYAAKKTPACVAKRRRDHLRRHYGMSVAEYEALYIWQAGRCACCWSAPATDVDHDHDTDGVRGLLCGPCNRMLGQANEEPARLLAGVDYLIRSDDDRATVFASTPRKDTR